MAKLYTEDFNHLELLKPKNETVQFILNYSKTLKIINYNHFQFETLQN